MKYNTQFYRDNAKSSRQSARVCVPVIMEFVRPNSVVDVGCGAGSWLQVFKEYGVPEVLGIDGPWAKPSQISEGEFLARDLAWPLNVPKKYDLVVSLETAEHLPRWAAESFVTSLTELGPIVVFSAAIPKQGGVNHLNEQWPEYWAELFARRGYEVVDCLRKRLWNSTDVEVCYIQNMVFFVERKAIDRYPQLSYEKTRTVGDQLAIVHPRLYIMRSEPKSVSPKLAAVALAYTPAKILRRIVIEIRNLLK